MNMGQRRKSDKAQIRVSLREPTIHEEKESITLFHSYLGNARYGQALCKFWEYNSE